MTRQMLRQSDPGLAVCLAAAFGDGDFNFTAELPDLHTRQRWMCRQATYLIMRDLLMRNADALADVLERTVGRGKQV